MFATSHPYDPLLPTQPDVVKHPPGQKTDTANLPSHDTTDKQDTSKPHIHQTSPNTLNPATSSGENHVIPTSKTS